MSNGFVIAKPGFNATDAEETETYVTTKAPILKVAQRGTGKIAFGLADAGTSKSVVINHNLGYRPLVQIFCEHKPGSRLSLVASTIVTIVGDKIHAVSFVDEDTFTIRFTAFDAIGDPTGEYKYYYYVFFDDSEQD